MSTYCRITGKSRGLPKPHYFPLLPPISPADARRICRITGKSYGLPTHHFIPVLTAVSKARAKPCHITSKSEGHDAHHYAPASMKHEVQKGFRYLAPLLEANVELMHILEGKPLDENNRQFIYTVDESKCTLVLPGQLESAIRDGDVRDIMLSKDSDKILVKLRKGPTVELNVKDYCMDGMELFEGEGPSKEAILKRKKRKTNDNTNWRRKIFEDKEKEAMSEEERLSEIKSKRIKVKLEAWKEHPVFNSWKNVRVEPTETQADHQFQVQLKNLFHGLQSNQNLNDLVNVTGKPFVDSLPQPIKIESQIVDLSHSLPGIIQQPIVVGDSVTGFPVAKIVAPFQPFVEDMDPKIVSVLKEFNANKPALYNILQKQNAIQQKQATSLPTLENVPELVKSLCKWFEEGTPNGKNNKFEKGLKVLIGDVEKFVPGQFLKTDKGEIFVPGNVVETSTGPTFVPGLVLRTDQGTKFLPGFIFKDEVNTPVFVAGQNALTRHGEKFVQGQVLQTNDGARFMPGQTIITPEGAKFVPGQIINDQKCKNGHRFVPGQIVMTPEGPQFVTGYFSQNPCTGEVSFVAGQAILNENCNWEFVPGQNMKTEDGGYVFVAGKEITDDEGQNHFVPGQVVIGEGDVERFVPGIAVNDESGNIHFIPGMEVKTENGLKFIEGVIVAKDDGTVTFVAGKMTKNEKDVIEFENAKNVDDLIFHDVHSGMTLNAAAVSSAEGTEVFGHLVQSAQGVEFFPGEAAGLPAGKVIPGKLVRGKEIRFIPGTMSDGKFTPGQFITTDTEEKFIPGQVIETNEGPKFVPGQVLQTRTGPKFVPGQTMETENGPKFIPGQIIETKRGPTFIPGQVIFTEEEGSRFVPGQVVDTVEGPRFVPGRVVETGDHVTFIPGQIVETEEGLKFIAPDLEDDPEGGYQFTVQGFEVAPEEVNLIGNSIPHACFIGEMAVDAKTLQQLAEAGMAVGRQLPVDIPSVNIRSLPVTEAACRIAHNLDIDASQSVKMSHILSTLQQVKHAGVSLTPEEIDDDSLEALVYLALESEHDKESYEFLQMLGDALEDTIKVDENKVESINSLHKLSAILAGKVREKVALINTVASQLSAKLNIDSAYVQGKVGQILSNLEHIKKSNVFIPRKEIKDKNLKMLLNLVSDCDPEVAEHNLLRNLATALENTVQVDPNHGLETIETLCNLTDDLAGKARTKMLPSIGIAHAVTSNLDLDPANAVKMNHILANLQQIKKSNVVFTKEQLNDENLQVLLNFVQTDDDSNEKEDMQALASLLENTLKLNPNHTLDAIEKLHKLTANVAKKANIKSALVSNAVKNMAKKFDMSEENSNQLDKIVTGLMKVKNSNGTNFANKIENKDVKALISLAQDNKNLSDEDFLEVLANQLGNITNSHNINLLQASTADIISQMDRKTKLKSEAALTIASELEMSPEYLVKMVDILSNLHEIKKAEVAIDNEDINNENLEVLLNLAKGSNVNKGDTMIIKNLSTALMNTLNVDPEQKLQIVNQLHSLTSNLVKEVQNKVIKINRTASVIAEKINIDKSQSAKIAQILSNLEQIKLSNLESELLEDKNLKHFLETVLVDVDKVDNTQFLDTTSIALENLLNCDIESKQETINKLEELTHTLVNNAEDRSKKVIESACAIAKDLNVSTPQLVKIGQILSNLQVIKKSNTAISSNDIGDGNLELLLNLAMACDKKADDPDVLRTFTDVLEKTLKLDEENKVQTIDNLDKLTSNLASDSVKKSMLTKQSANMIANNLNLSEKQAVQLSQILSNLEQLCLSNIQLEEGDKDLQTLVNIAKQFKGNTQNKEFLELVGDHLQGVLKDNLEDKYKIIDTLQKKSANLVAKGREKSKLIAETAFIIANDLNLNTSYLLQLNHILSNLQEIQESGIAISNDAVKDENLKLVLNLGLACNAGKNEMEVVKTLADILQNTIQIQPEEKLNTIESLHMLTADLTKVTQAKSEAIRQASANFAEKYNLVPQSAKLNQILHNVQHIISSKSNNVGNAIILDQNTQEFISKILETNISDADGQAFQEIVLPALEKYIKSDLENKSSNIDTLHLVTTDLDNKIQSQLLLTTETALAMGNDLNLSTPQVVQISHILSNLQQIKETNFIVSEKDMDSENLEMLMNLALISDGKTCNIDSIQAFGNALQKIIKNVDPTAKICSIAELQDETSLLAIKAQEKLKKVDKTASKLAVKLQLDKPYSVKLGQILANLQEMKISNMDISKLKMTDQNLKLLVQTALVEDFGENDSKFLQVIGHVLESSLAQDMDHKLQNIDLIYAFTCEVISKKRKQALLNTETAFTVSKELGLQKPQTVKINHILSNLQKIQNANLAVTHKSEDNTKLLLDLALACKDNKEPESVNILADALIKTIAINPKENVKMIDQLDKCINSLAEEIPEKTILKREIAKAVKENLNLNDNELDKVEQILSNLQHIKLSNINPSKEEIKNKVVEQILKNCQKCDIKSGDVAFLEAVGSILQKDITQANVEELYEVINELAFKAKDYTLLAAQSAYSLGTDLNMKTSELVKISQILSNLHKFKIANIALPENRIANADLEVLLSLTIAEDSTNNPKDIKSIAIALEKTLKASSKDLIPLIDDLNLLTSEIAKLAENKMEVLEKVADDMVNKLGIDSTHSSKVYKVISNLQQIILADVDRQELEQIEDKNTRKLITEVLQSNASNGDLQSIENITQVLGKMVTSDLGEKLQILQTVHEVTNALIAKVHEKSRITLGVSTDVTNELNLTGSQPMIQVNHILTNLQHMKQSNFMLPENTNIQNDDVKLLVNLALGSISGNNSSNEVKTFAEALKKTLNLNPQETPQTLETLTNSIADIAIKTCAEHKLIQQIANQMVKDLNMDDSHTGKLSHILTNLQCLKSSQLPIDIKMIEDEFLKGLIEVISNSNHKISNIDFKTQAKEALESIIRMNPENGLQIINFLHKQTDDLVSKVNNTALMNTKIAYDIANEINVQAPHLMKMNDILTNLQQLKQVDFMPECDSKDNSLELLMNLALESNSKKNEIEIIENLANALKQTAKIENTQDTIDTLHQLTTALTSQGKEKYQLVVDTATNIAEACILDEKQVEKLKDIIIDIQRIKHSKIDWTKQNIPDKKLSAILSDIIDASTETAIDQNLVQATGAAIQKALLCDLDHKNQNIDYLHAIAHNIAAKARDRALLMTETACIVGQELNMGTLQVAKVGHILSNLHNIKESHMSTPINAIEDKNLELLLTLALPCDISKPDDQTVKMLAHILENTLNIDPEQKAITVDNLFALTNDLAKSSNLESKLIETNASKMVQNLNVGEAYFIKLCNILSNLHQIKLSKIDISQHVIKNKNWEALINSVLQGEDNLEDAEFYKSLANQVENVIRADPEHKLQNINSLHDVLSSIMTKESNKMYLVASTAYNMAKELGVNTEDLMKIGHILSDLQGLNQVNVAISKSDIKDDKVQVLLNLALADSEKKNDAEVMKTLSTALQNIIQLDHGENRPIIDSLHIHTAELSIKAQEKFTQIEETACQLATRLGMDATKTIKLSHILSNLEKFAMSGIDLEKEDIKHSGIKNLMKSALHEGNQIINLEYLAMLVENFLKDDLQHQSYNLDELHNCLSIFNAKVNNKVQALTENALQVASDLNLGVEGTIKMAKILSNVQQIKEAGVALLPNEIENDNLGLLLNLAQEYRNQTLESELDYIKKLKTVLQSTIKMDLNHKEQMIEELFALTTDTTSKVTQKAQIFKEYGNMLGNELNLDKERSMKLTSLLSNLQRLAQSNIDMGQNIDNTDVKILFQLSKKCANKNDEDFVKIIGKSLEKVLKSDINHMVDNIDVLSQNVSELATELMTNTLQAATTSQAMAFNLKLNTSEAVQISDVLLNLQHISEMDVPLDLNNIQNEDIKLIVNLALSSSAQKCDGSIELMSTLGNAFEKLMELRPELKSDAINSLHNTAANLVKEVDQISMLINNATENLIKNLKIDQPSKEKLCSIFTGLLSINQANIEVPQEYIKNEFLKMLLSSIREVGHASENTEVVQGISQALESIIKANIEHKHQIIEELEAAITDLVTGVKSKFISQASVACCVANHLNINESSAVSINEVISDMKQLKQMQAFISNADIQDQNIRLLFNHILALKGDGQNSELLQTLGDAIEYTVMVEKNDKVKNINELQLVTSQLVLVAKNRSALIEKTASKVASKLKVDSSKVNKILSNLQQIRRSSIFVSMEDIPNKDVHNLVNFALENDNVDDVQFFGALAELLEKLIKANIQHKSQTIDSLCTITTDLTSGTWNKALITAETAHNIASSLNMDALSINVNHILSNLQQIKSSNIPISVEKVQDEDLKLILNAALAYDGDIDSSDFVQVLGHALKNTINLRPNQAIKTLTHFHTLTDDLTMKVKEESCVIKEIATKVASNLKVESSTISDIIINLKEAYLYNLASVNDIENEDLKALFYLASECGYDYEDVEFLQALGDAIENIIEIDLDHKSQKIDTLHALSTKLASAARQKALLITLMAGKMVDKLNIDPSHSVTISRILTNLQEISESGFIFPSADIKDKNMALLLKQMANIEAGKEECQFLSELGQTLENMIAADPKHKLEIMNSLQAQSSDILREICEKPPNKVQLLKSLIKNNLELRDDVVEKLSSILDENEMAMCVAFRNMSRENPDFVGKVLQNTASILNDKRIDEKKAIETLHRAIVKAVGETSEQEVTQVLRQKEGNDFRSLVVDASGLAKALGMNEVVHVLDGILNDSRSMPVFAKDKIVMEVLKRLTVMRQLAEKQPTLRAALHDLQYDPYAARNDPRLRALVRDSAVLMVIPEESLILRSSADIPCSLLFGDNTLAVEDFMVKSRQTGKTFLILKKGVQMVVPREAARDVLTGKVPYTVLDENGIHHFTPLHVFNALKLPRVATNRFSNYGYSPKMSQKSKAKGEASEKELLFSRCSSISVDDSHKNFPNGSCSTQEDRARIPRGYRIRAMEEEFQVIKDYVGDGDFSLEKGDRVKILEANDDDPTLDESSKKMSHDSRDDLLPIFFSAKEQ